ncbi:hypothetical protein U1Q18_012776 [Sarracenia purpurea var. burkii]
MESNFLGLATTCRINNVQPNLLCQAQYLKRTAVTLPLLQQGTSPFSTGHFPFGDHSTAVGPPFFSGRNTYRHSGSISTHSGRFADLACKNRRIAENYRSDLSSIAPTPPPTSDSPVGIHPLPLSFQIPKIQKQGPPVLAADSTGKNQIQI